MSLLGSIQQFRRYHKLTMEELCAVARDLGLGECKAMSKFALIRFITARLEKSPAEKVYERIKPRPMKSPKPKKPKVRRVHVPSYHMRAEVPSRSPSLTAAEHLTRAKEERCRGLLLDALFFAFRAVTHDPNDYHARFTLALTLDDLGDLYSARQAYIEFSSRLHEYHRHFPNTSLPSEEAIISNYSDKRTDNLLWQTTASAGKRGHPSLYARESTCETAVARYRAECEYQVEKIACGRDLNSLWGHDRDEVNHIRAHFAKAIDSCAGRPSLGASLPSFEEPLSGDNSLLHIKNPNRHAVRIGIRSRRRGMNIEVAAGDWEATFAPDGQYELYLINSENPIALFQGDSFTLEHNTIAIQLVTVVDGNYPIRRIA